MALKGFNVGRVRANIKVNGADYWTLFDTGARNTYIVADRVGSLVVWNLQRPEPSAIGGKTHMIRHHCGLTAEIDGYQVSVNARIVEEIGRDEEGKRIEVLFGALAMQNYGINVDTKNERLDFTHYPKEFVEF